MLREGRQNVDKPHGHKWEQLCPVTTPLAYKDPPFDIGECPAVPDPHLVHRFRVVNGFLQYIVITRPEVIHATNQLARVAKSPGPRHVKAMDHVLRYLAGTNYLALRIGPKDEEASQHPSGFFAYADASHKIQELGWRGITGYCIWYEGALLSARSTVQDLLTFSSAEAEYVAYSTAIQEIEAVRLLLRDFGLSFTQIPLLVDNQPAISIAAGTTSRSRSRHIDFKAHLCRDFVNRGIITLQYVSTDDQLADIFTKQLSPQPFLRHRARLVCPIPLHLL